MEANQFLSVPEIFYGEGALGESQDKLGEMGEKALIVTDHVMEEQGYLEKTEKALEESGVDYAVYKDINTEPKDIHVENGAEIYQDKDCDFLLALGGGSPIDTMKAIGAVLSNPGHIRDYEGLGVIDNDTPPLVAIPTTAGTGSEVTQFTIIHDTRDDVKMLIGDAKLMPDAAVVDPTFTLTVPEEITAATGIDALTHAVEAYTSKNHQPLADNFALSSIERIADNLRKACEDGDDMEARSEMMLGAMEAGMAFNNSSVTIVHGMSRPIGACFHIPHGLSNAVLLEECMKFAVDGAPERFADVAEAMGVNTDDLSVEEAAEKGVEAIGDLCDDIGIPCLCEQGVCEEDFQEKKDKMAKDALDSGSPDNTMKVPDKEDLKEIYDRII
ncbi:iron-containing alcohol dehydrogenase [Halarsenatibacter silvermanii]|uniref:1,3-propanediol dehydrogenase n=1 Tax=Halarsenatibacter silvermanii TaxID=321763 RepID=A0A1G9PVZ2_9FIRM|nr:iron-containing alcohol dehydrogenase [Halarsenatibacter silvermanii]SDM02813.1 1,3-propanediol dehydrogenase [Halarsenatibacter silvermanii]